MGAPTREDVYTAIRNADKAGDSAAVRKLGAYLQTMDAPAAPVSGAAAIPGASQEQLASARAGMQAKAPEQQDNLLGKIVGPFDAALGVASSVVTPLVAVPGGFIKAMYENKDDGRTVQQNAQDIADRIQYRPATNTGRKILETIGEASPVLDALPGVGNDLAVLGRGAAAAKGTIGEMAGASAVAQGAADAAMAKGGGKLGDLVRKPQDPALSGVGAARSPLATVRQQRATDLGLDPLTKGQASREPTQVRSERELAKQPEGTPLAERFGAQNQQLLSKFDEYYDQTGAQAPTLRATGSIVNNVVVNKYRRGQAEVNAAYRTAEKAGETAEPVPYSALADYLDTNSAKIDTGNVPMLGYVRAQLKKLDPEGTGFIPVNEMEEIRRGAGSLSEPGTPNGAHIKDVKRLIDGSMDYATGSLYQQARRLRENLANQFENVGVVDKLLSTKRGTNDRMVALEDVADHTLFNGSLDDVRQVRRVLQAGGGADGAQAWRELQGAGLNRMKEALFPEHGAQDASGNPVPRPTALKKLVADMDSDGKLEFIYGKQGAAQIRDLADAAVDVNYQTGANFSGTGSAMQDFLNERMNAVLRLVPGGGKVAEHLAKRAQSKAKTQRVEQALNNDNQP